MLESVDDCFPEQKRPVQDLSMSKVANNSGQDLQGGKIQIVTDRLLLEYVNVPAPEHEHLAPDLAMPKVANKSAQDLQDGEDFTGRLLLEKVNFADLEQKGPARDL